MKSAAAFVAGACAGALGVIVAAICALAWEEIDAKRVDRVR